MPMMPKTSDTPMRLVSSIQSERIYQPPKPALNACGVPQIPAFGQYYVYASGPKLSSMDRPKSKLPSANILRVADTYHNMMWDPRVYRGSTYKTYKKAEEERCIKHAKELAKASNQQKKAAGNARRQSGKPGASGSNSQSHRTIGGISRPKTPPHHSERIGLEDMGIQTEKFLEEITDEVKERDMCTQTDRIFDLKLAPDFCATKLGVDVQTQIQPWELFNFNEEVQPILTSLVGKVIEQALLETMEEVELDSLREQQCVYEERNRVERMRLQRLYEREQRMTEERARLIAERRQDARNEKDAEGRIGANLFAVNYLDGMSDFVLDELRRDGHMAGSNNMVESFIPWLHNRSMWRFCNSTAGSTVLDDVIKNVVDTREAEVADGIWREISAQNQLFQMQSDTGFEYMSDQYGDE